MAKKKATAASGSAAGNGKPTDSGVVDLTKQPHRFSSRGFLLNDGSTSLDANRGVVR